MSTALQQTERSPLSADVALTSEPWGTKLEMTCRYAAGQSWSVGSSGSLYALYVTDRAGMTTRVSSWTADPGSTVHPTATIDTPISDITSVEVRAVADGQVLLTKSLG